MTKLFSITAICFFSAISAFAEHVTLNCLHTSKPNSTLRVDFNAPAPDSIVIENQDHYRDYGFLADQQFDPSSIIFDIQDTRKKFWLPKDVVDGTAIHTNVRLGLTGENIYSCIRQ